MHTLFRPLVTSALLLAACASAQAVPYTIDFFITETPDLATTDFDFSINIISPPLGPLLQSIHYDVASGVFSTKGAPLAQEVFTPGQNSFHDVWTLDTAAAANVQFQTSLPQSFSNIVLNGVSGDTGPQSLSLSYLVNNPINPATANFNLTDPGVGSITFAAAALPGGAPELDPAGAKWAVSLLALGFGVLRQRKKITPGLASS